MNSTYKKYDNKKNILKSFKLNNSNELKMEYLEMGSLMGASIAWITWLVESTFYCD